MSDPKDDRETPAAAAEASPAVRHRPIERFWPYRDLSEQPDEEELASLDPAIEDEPRSLSENTGKGSERHEAGVVGDTSAIH